MTAQDADYKPIPPEDLLIAIVPVGPVEEDVLKVVADSVQGLVKLPVDVRQGIELPPDSYLASRDQFNAMALLKMLAADHTGDCLKVLGLCSRDITNPILTYVFGEAYMDGKSAVMSYARLRTGPGTESVSREMLLDRAVKVAVHEIGHTFNIPHCHNGRCVMRASNSLQELDDKLNYLCEYCEMFLAESLTKTLKKPAE